MKKIIYFLSFIFLFIIFLNYCENNSTPYIHYTSSTSTIIINMTNSNISTNPTNSTSTINIAEQINGIWHSEYCEYKIEINYPQFTERLFNKDYDILMTGIIINAGSNLILSYQSVKGIAKSQSISNDLNIPIDEAYHDIKTISTIGSTCDALSPFAIYEYGIPSLNDRLYCNFFDISSTELKISFPLYYNTSVSCNDGICYTIVACNDGLSCRRTYNSTNISDSIHFKLRR